MWDQGSKGWDQGSGEWDLRSQPRDQGSQTMGSGSAGFFRDQGSGCTIFVGSGNKIGHASGIKDQKFACKNVMSEEKTYLVTTLYWIQRRSSARGRTRFAEDNMIYNRDLLMCWSFLATSRLWLIY